MSNVFMAGIFPEILKHPVNCDILTHSDNSSKRDKSSITIDQLFEAIINFTGSYKHQEQILLLITYWRKGERFCANKYRRASGE